ncbi:MAG: lipopolysaccharide biosynthesis protein [Terracidiphilus sp.]|jgi:O-antigen/teichoic acid export membrane protein
MFALMAQSYKSGVRRNLASTLAGNIVFSGSQFLITVVLARLSNIAIVGQYALGLALCTPVFAFTGLQMRAVEATDCTGRFRFADYLNVRLAGSACAMGVILFMAVFASWSRGTLMVVLAVACTKAVDSLSDLLYGLLQLHERLDLVAQGMCARAFAGLLALLSAMSLTHSVVIALLALSMAWLIVLFTFEWPMVLRVESAKRSELWRLGSIKACSRLILLCVPLALVLLVLNSATSLPRVILEHSAGERTLGVFSAVAAISAGIGLLYTAVGQTALPRLAKMFMSDRKSFDAAILQMMLFSFALGAPLVVAAWFWGVTAVNMTYGRLAQVSSGLVAGLVAVGVFSNTSSLLGAGMTASRRFWPQLGVACLVLAVTAAGCRWLIPSMGAMGAMYACLAGAVIQTVAYAFLCGRC